MCRLIIGGVYRAIISLSFPIVCVAGCGGGGTLLVSQSATTGGETASLRAAQDIGNGQLARIVAIQQSHPAAIDPCVALNRGIFSAAVNENAQFTLDFRFQYPSGGGFLDIPISVPVRDMRRCKKNRLGHHTAALRLGPVNEFHL